MRNRTSPATGGLLRLADGGKQSQIRAQPAGLSFTPVAIFSRAAARAAIQHIHWAARRYLSRALPERALLHRNEDRRHRIGQSILAGCPGFLYRSHRSFQRLQPTFFHFGRLPYPRLRMTSRRSTWPLAPAADSLALPGEGSRRFPDVPGGNLPLIGASRSPARLLEALSSWIVNLDALQRAPRRLGPQAVLVGNLRL